ncbi:MAG: type II secretion system protein [Clostridia bacterium]
MINKLKQRLRKSLQSTKGFTLVELIVVTVIIMILATMAVSAYLSFVEDAAIAKDVVYVKGIVSEIEILCAQRKLTLPTTINAKPAVTSTANSVTYNSSYFSYNTGSVMIPASDATAWSTTFYSASSSSASIATANLDIIKTVCQKQALESNTANSGGGVIISYQLVNNVAKVFVYSQTPDNHWYPYAQTWGGADSF